MLLTMPTIKFKNGSQVNKKKIIIEIFCAPNCARCRRAVTLVQEVIENINNSSVHWQKKDVVEEIDYAVSLGIRATPAIIINGKLTFTASPDKKTLQKIIMELL